MVHALPSRTATGEDGRTVHLSITREEEKTMNWVDPAYCDLRLGFEVTAYVYVR